MPNEEKNPRKKIGGQKMGMPVEVQSMDFVIGGKP